MSPQEANFLHQRNPNLHTSQEVEITIDYLRNGGDTIPNNPSEKITAYVGFLASEECVNDGLLTGDRKSLNRQVEASVIRDEDVPESYFELQRRIAHERGHGDITITPAMRKEMVKTIQTDQRVSLKSWAGYLASGDDGASYPEWFRLYAFDGVKKLSGFDQEKGEFSKRSKGTTAPYPELNREALAHVYDTLRKSRLENETIDGDEQFQKMLRGANFGKLYAYAIRETAQTSPEERENIQGSWTKFDQGDEPETAQILAASLQGHGTGWCTAGESIAAQQLQDGDFYVYYSKDKDGNDVVPRVAIRMQSGRVAEVRGVKKGQELEAEMFDIAAEKLEVLPGGDVYATKAEDMKQVTILEKKLMTDNAANLTTEEFTLLYELDHRIEGFGFKPDPRLTQLRNIRGNLDRPALTEVVPELIRKQYKQAYDAYQSIAQGMGIEPEAKSKLTDLFRDKSREWKANGTYDFVIDQLVKSGASFDLIMTPNLSRSNYDTEWENALFDDESGADWLTHPTSDAQVSSGNYYDDYDFGVLDDDEGEDTTPPVEVKLIQKAAIAEDEITIPEADAMLKEIREKHPFLNARLPELADVATYWHSHIDSGKPLSHIESNFYAGSRYDRMFRTDDAQLYGTEYYLDDGNVPGVMRYLEEGLDIPPRFVIG